MHRDRHLPKFHQFKLKSPSTSTELPCKFIQTITARHDPSPDLSLLRMGHVPKDGA
jgi:hypothetical protein